MCFSRVRLSFFYFKRESVRLLFFLKVVYCHKSISTFLVSVKQFMENANVEMKTGDVQNKCFDAEKQSICAFIDSLLWRLSSKTFYTFFYFVSESKK